MVKGEGEGEGEGSRLAQRGGVGSERCVHLREHGGMLHPYPNPDPNRNPTLSLTLT